MTVMELPSSGYKILRLIIIGYLHQGGSDRKPATYEEVSKSTSVNPTMVSANNKALAALGIVEKSGGRGSYRLTSEGYELARALEFEETQLTRRALEPILRQNTTISQAVNAVRAKNGMSIEDFVSHLVYVAGAKNTKSNLTGARAVLEMLLVAGILQQSDDRVVVSPEEQSDSDSAPDSNNVSGDLADDESGDQLAPRQEWIERGRNITINVDIALSADDLIDDERFATVLERLENLRNVTE